LQGDFSGLLSDTVKELRNMKKRTIILSLVFILFLEYLLFFGIFNNNISPACAFFVYLLPILTIEMIGLWLISIVKVNTVFFPIHCCIIGEVMIDNSTKYEDMISFIVVNFALFFIITGYIVSLQKHLEKNNSLILINRIFVILPITCRIVFICLAITILLLILYPHMRYSLFLHPAFHCIAYIFCPFLFIIAFLVAVVYPQDVHCEFHKTDLSK
jgi:hypothetical protein